MTDKMLKFLTMLLLLASAMAGAFCLLTPSFFAEKGVETRQRSQVVSLRESPLAEKPDSISQRLEPSQITEATNPGVVINEEGILGDIRSWARKDPEAALVWAQQQPNNEERTEALTDACFQIAQADPKRAVVLAEQFNLGQNGVLENLAQQWATKDLPAAYNWIMAQPADGQRDALMTGMTFIWSQTKPAAAAQFVAQQIPPGPAQDEAVMMVLHQWALVDPTGAGAWVQQFPESPLRDQALNELSGIAQYKQSIPQSK